MNLLIHRLTVVTLWFLLTTLIDMMACTEAVSLPLGLNLQVGIGAPRQVAANIQLDESTGYAVPVEYDPPSRPLPTVQIRVNGSRPLTFVIDTGWEQAFFLLPWAVAELKLATTKDKVLVQPGNVETRRIDGFDIAIVPLANDPQIKIHVANSWTGDLKIFDEYPVPKIAGILGADLFQHLTATFDFDKKRILFFFDKHPQISGPTNSISIPLVNRAGSGLPSVRLRLPGNRDAEFIVDTGSNTSTVRSAPTGNVTRIASATTFFNSIAGSTKVEEILLRSLPLGKWDVPLVSLTLTNDPSRMALDVLARFKFTLDMRNGYLTLEPGNDQSLKLPGAPDIEIERKGANYFLTRFSHSSITEGGGALGDRVVSVDGKDVSDSTYIETAFRLQGYAGTIGSLVLEHPDKRRVVVSFWRHTRFTNIIAATDGMVWIVDDDRKLRIVAIDPGTRAAHAGLQLGDEIVSILEKPVKGLSPQFIQDHLLLNAVTKSDHVGITVKRKASGEILHL